MVHRARATIKCGTNRKTAHKYLVSGKLPSERSTIREWRTLALAVIDKDASGGDHGGDTRGMGSDQSASGDLDRGRGVAKKSAKQLARVVAAAMPRVAAAVFASSIELWGPDAHCRR